MSLRTSPPQPPDPNPKFRLLIKDGWTDWYVADVALDVIGNMSGIKAIEIRETMTEAQFYEYLRKFAI